MPGRGTFLIIPDGRRVGRPRSLLAAELAPRRENAPVRAAARPGIRAAPDAVRARRRERCSAASPRSRLAPAVLAHGTAVPPPPDLATFVFGWTFDPLAWLPAIVALLLWWMGVGRVNRAHPEHPVPAPADRLLGRRA